MKNHTIKKLSKCSEGLSKESDTIDLPIHLFPPSIPTHKELLVDIEESNKKRVLNNMYEQSKSFYSYDNINIAA